MTSLSKKDIKQVKHLYCVKKCSAREVAEELNISVDSVYGLMKNYNILRRSFSEANSVWFQKQPLSFSLKINLTDRERRLKIAGIMLYWAEGAKVSNSQNNRNCTVDLANSNPEMIRIFLNFLRTICGIDNNRLRCLLYCYANQDIEYIKEYWSKITGISLDQFTKPYVREDFSKEKIGKMKYGLIHIRYNDKKLFLQIQKWINEYVKNNL